MKTVKQSPSFQQFQMNFGACPLSRFRSPEETCCHAEVVTGQVLRWVHDLVRLTPKKGYFLHLRIDKTRKGWYA